MTDTLPDFQTPPQTNARRIENEHFAAELRAQPGTWKRYPFDLARPRDLRYRINHGLAAAFPEGFTAKIRDGVVYLAYNPKDTA